MGDSESNKFSRQGSDMSIRKDLWAPVYFYFYYFYLFYIKTFFFFFLKKGDNR